MRQNGLFRDARVACIEEQVNGVMMQTWRHSFSRIMIIVSVQGLLFGFLAGCSKTENNDAFVLKPNNSNNDVDSLPEYRVGTKFIYSDGTWEQVAETGPGWVKWVNNRNHVSIGSPDFTYKRSQWITSYRKGTREFKQTEYWFDKPTTTLWPLMTGKKTRFDEFGSWSAKDSRITRQYDSFWRCEVKGTEEVSVAAGDFDTWIIGCSRYSNSFSYPSRAREYRTWNYAPIIGHWVREVRDYNGSQPNRKKELVALLPDLSKFTENEEDLRQLKKQFQNALEWNKKNMPEIWAGPKNQLTVNVYPTRTFRHTDGNVCRQFAQNITLAGRVDEYYGIACRDSQGVWKIPRR